MKPLVSPNYLRLLADLLESRNMHIWQVGDFGEWLNQVKDIVGADKLPPELLEEEARMLHALLESQTPLP